MDERPEIILEYLPCGNLREAHRQQRLSEPEILGFAEQALLALTFLHGQDPPIAHRDIKPENILLKSRSPLYIKLGDFGLSKQVPELQTLCGTMQYLPPELAPGRPTKLRYTEAVDIWSLGVVIFEYMYDLPQHSSVTRRNPYKWCEAIVHKMQNQDDGDILVENLLQYMITLDPAHRLSAKACVDRLRLVIAPVDASGTPTSQSTSQYDTSVADTEIEDPLRPSELLDTVQSDGDGSQGFSDSDRVRNGSQSAGAPSKNASPALSETIDEQEPASSSSGGLIRGSVLRALVAQDVKRKKSSSGLSSSSLKAHITKRVAHEQGTSA